MILIGVAAVVSLLLLFVVGKFFFGMVKQQAKATFSLGLIFLCLMLLLVIGGGVAAFLFFNL